MVAELKFLASLTFFRPAAKLFVSCCTLRSRTASARPATWSSSAAPPSTAPEPPDPPTDDDMALSLRPKSLYRRPLQLPCVAFSSEDGRKLFREALLEGNMESYFRLAEQFRTQDDPAFCGLSTLTMVLNALAVDPGRVWKGPWRWYHESMLDCCAPLDMVRQDGITLSTMYCLARCNGLHVDMGGPGTKSIEDLRAVIKECSSEDRGKVVVVSYDRRGLKQTGSGHFSPIGGYHKVLDLVLILDTARFKLPPHWVPLSMLWEAMKTLDPATDKPRGYMVLEKAHSFSHRLFTAKAENHEDWPTVASWTRETIEMISVREEPHSEDDVGREFREATTVEEFTVLLLARVPPEVKDLLTTFNATGKSSCTTVQAHDGIVLQAIQGTDAYREIIRMERSNQEDRSYSCSSSSSDEDSSVRSPTSSQKSRASPCPVGSGCGCSSRHVLSVLTYALLSMLHARDSRGESAGSDALDGGQMWRQDPLESLPKPVAEEAMHVAAMLSGLMDMELSDQGPAASVAGRQ